MLSAHMIRLFATGLVGATLAATRPAAAGLNQNLGDISANQTGVVGVKLPPDGVRVNSPRDLLLTLFDERFTGRVIIPHDVQWDLSGYGSIPLRAGVELIGERGALGSRPLLFTNAPTLDGAGYDFFIVVGNNVRVERIHLRGPPTATAAAASRSFPASTSVSTWPRTR